MPNRLAILTIYTPDNMPADRLGYVREIQVVCTLNYTIEAFTIRKDRPLWGKTQYTLVCDLPSVKTGRQAGRKKFDTLDEAIVYGRDLVTRIFPLLTTDDCKDIPTPPVPSKADENSPT